MKDSEKLRTQESALAKIDAIAKQVASGELDPADADAKMSAIMHEMQRETSRHLSDVQAAGVRRRRQLLIVAFVATSLFTLVVYRMLL